MLRKAWNKIRDLLTISLACLFLISGCSLIFSATTSMFDKPDAESFQAVDDVPAWDLKDIQKNSQDKDSSLLALFQKDRHGKLQFRCSATVVSDKLALTAAHCLVDEDQYMQTDDIVVKNVKNEDRGTAKPAVVNLRADLGMITGDFSKFNKMPVAISPGGFLSGATGPFMSCGFAWGAFPAICDPFIPKTNYEFLESGIGRLFPGMSGGPVVDQRSGFVVAVNSRVGVNAVMVAPTTGIQGALELQIVK